MVFLSKVLQNTANGTYFNEEHMRPFNGFVSREKERLAAFLLSLGDGAAGPLPKHPLEAEQRRKAALLVLQFTEKNKSVLAEEMEKIKSGSKSSLGSVIKQLQQRVEKSRSEAKEKKEEKEGHKEKRPTHREHSKEQLRDDKDKDKDKEKTDIPMPRREKHRLSRDLSLTGTLSSSSLHFRSTATKLEIISQVVVRGDLELLKGFKTKLLLTPDSDSETPLHVAATHGKTEIVRYLLDSRADPYMEDKRGWTPLHCSTWYNHNPVTSILLQVRLLLFELVFCVTALC